MSQARGTIRIQSLVLTQYDWRLATRNLRPTRGVVIVEMMPPMASVGGIYLTQKMRDDVGMVIAAHPSSGFIPGTYVVVDYNAGSIIEGFSAGTYRARGEVRIFGRDLYLDDDTDLTIGQRNVASIESIHGTINADMIPIQEVFDGDMIQESKRLSIDTYESYAKSKEGGNNFIIQDPQRATVTNRVTLPAGVPVRIVVRSSLSDVLDVRIEIIGRTEDYDLEFAHVTNRELPLRPCGKKLLIELDELHTKSAGGIELPDAHTFRTCKATVLAVGAMCDEGISVGDRVIVKPTGLHYHDLSMVGIINNKCIKLCREDAIQTMIYGESALEVEDSNVLVHAS